MASAVTVSQALGALATPFVGRMVDRWGVRRVTLPFIAAFALTTAAIALTPASPFIFILLYGICGLFGGGQAPLNYAKAISSWFESKRGLALGIAMSGVGIGTALDPQIVRVLIEHVGWRGAYVGLGVLTFALAFPAVALFIREPDRDSLPDREHLASAGHTHDAAGNAPGMPVGEAVKGFRFWTILVCVFMVAASVNGSIAHIVPILTDRGISPAMATSLLSVTGNRADRRQNPERIYSRSLFRALRRGLLFSLAAYRRRTPQQRSGRNRSAARNGLPGTWTRIRNRHHGVSGRALFRRAHVRGNLRVHHGCVRFRFGTGTDDHGRLLRPHAFLQARARRICGSSGDRQHFDQPAGPVCVSSAEADGDAARPRRLRLATNVWFGFWLGVLPGSLYIHTATRNIRSRMEFASQAGRSAAKSTRRARASHHRKNGRFAGRERCAGMRCS